MHLVVYGSFNCPYSFLASRRARRLVDAGETSLEWRAVVHDADVPAGGVPVAGELAETFDRELEEIGGLLAPGEDYPARRPPVQPNTTAAVAGYAAQSDGGRQGETDALRASLFEAFWVDGLDIGDAEVLARLGCPPAAPGETMQRWQSLWESTERRVVPMMVLEDGTLSRGLGALKRLADFAGAEVLR